MLEIFLAGLMASLHVFLNAFTIKPKQSHRVVIILSSGMEYMSVECSCGKDFWSR